MVEAMHIWEHWVYGDEKVSPSLGGCEDGLRVTHAKTVYHEHSILSLLL